MGKTTKDSLDKRGKRRDAYGGAEAPVTPNEKANICFNSLNGWHFQNHLKETLSNAILK